jgi:hypothetical protein
MKSRVLLLATLMPFLVRAATAQSHESSPSPGVVQRGDHVMGFDHEKTVHHFRLTKTGGSIEAEAKDGADSKSREQIRMHFAHIAKMFSEGDFDAPMLIHARVPPGVPEMKKRRHAIRYEVEESPNGGRIVMTTKDSRARAAIHDFLRFQIRDHQTGDSLKVTAEN